MSAYRSAVPLMQYVGAPGLVHLIRTNTQFPDDWVLSACGFGTTPREDWLDVTEIPTCLPCIAKAK